MGQILPPGDPGRRLKTFLVGGTGGREICWHLVSEAEMPLNTHTGQPDPAEDYAPEHQRCQAGPH